MMRLALCARCQVGCVRFVFLLVAAVLILFSSSVRAEQDLSSGSARVSGSESDSGTAAPGASSEVTSTESTPPAEIAPKPVQNKSKTGTPAIAPLNIGTPPATVIGGFSADTSAEPSNALVLPRSGGLSSLIFESGANNWISTTLGLGQSYDSNVFLHSTKVSDFITRVSPAVAFAYSTKLLDWKLATSLDYGYYARNTRTEDFNYGLTTSGRVNLYRDYAYVLISDTYSQISQSASVDYTLLSSTVNVTDLNTLRFNPRFELPLSSRVHFNPQYAYVNYWYPSKSVQNRENHSVMADFSYELASGLTPSLGYNFVRMAGNFYKYNQNYPYFRLNYTSDRLNLTGSVGYSRLDLDSGGSSNSMVWDASVSYRLPTTSITLATSSDVDQTTYLTQGNSPQLITSYTANITRDFSKASLLLSLYYRKNTDHQTSEFISRRFGVNGSLKHTLTSRITSSLDFRVERHDDRYNFISSYVPVTVNGVTLIVPVTQNQGVQALLYQLGYTLSYSFNNQWTASCSYSYASSGSPNMYSSGVNNYADNKITIVASKSF